MVTYYIHLHNAPETSHSFYINIGRDDNPQSIVTATLDSMEGIGTYNLGDSAHGAWASYWSYNSDNDRPTYLTDSLRTGAINITKIDTAMRLISGTLNFDAINRSTTIHLTEGKFIARYLPH